MDLAWISLAALFIVILISSFSRTNVGILAMAFAWAIGYFMAGMETGDVASGFPTGLFLLLFGVTLLFSQIKVNGTLDRMAEAAIRLARGHRAVLPIVFFFLLFIFSALGPGNIGATALLAPLAMGIAARMGISPFLMTVMVVTGANAGTFSPLAPTGLIANGLAAASGLEMHPWLQIFLPNLLTQAFIAFASYAVFSRPLWAPEIERMEHPHHDHNAVLTAPQVWDWSHHASLLAVAVLIFGVALLGADAGFLSLSLAAVLFLLSPGDLKKSIAGVPWDAILMVCGVSTLTALLEALGGMDLFASFLARVSTPFNVTGVVALVTGVLSLFSSSSGVVMPAFIPAVPGLALKLQGADPAAIISAINVGSHVVDVSPLSTLGALCLASAGAREDKSKLFRNLLLYGLSLSLFGAAVCYFFLRGKHG